jgi:hypothetical protein
MVRTKVHSKAFANDEISVNGRHYAVNAEGMALVHPADVATLRDACGFSVIGQVADESRPAETTRLPASKEEFLDLALAIGLRGEDLRSMADLLDPPPPVPELPQPVTTYRAPPPPHEREIHVPDDEPQTESAAEAAPDQSGEDEEAKPPSVSLSWSKNNLFDFAAQLGLPVKKAMKKLEIFNLIREAQHEGQNVLESSAVGPT